MTHSVAVTQVLDDKDLTSSDMVSKLAIALLVSRREAYGAGNCGDQEYRSSAISLLGESMTRIYLKRYVE